VQTRVSTFRLPRQERPRASNVIATWKRIIRLCYSPAETHALERPMGRWYKGCINQVWDTVVDPDNGLVYMWINGRVRMYERRQRHQYRYVRTLRHSNFPLGCVPISGRLQCGIFHSTGYAKMKPSQATVAEHVIEMKNMNRGVRQVELSETIARAIGEGKPSWLLTDPCKTPLLQTRL
jgi:hypothetical protein